MKVSKLVLPGLALCACVGLGACEEKPAPAPAKPTAPAAKPADTKPADTKPADPAKPADKPAGGH